MSPAKSLTSFCLQQAEALRRIDRAKGTLANLVQSRNRQNKHSQGHTEPMARPPLGRTYTGVEFPYSRTEVIACRQPKEADMARGEQRSNREKRKPKKEKIKTITAAPSQKGAAAGWQPNLASGKKK